MGPGFIISIVGLRKPNWFPVDRGVAADGFVHRMAVMSSHLLMSARHVDDVCATIIRIRKDPGGEPGSYQFEYRSQET